MPPAPMTPERYDRLMEHFDAVCDLDPAARAPILAEIEAADPELAKALVELLAHDQPGGAALDAAASKMGDLAAEALAELSGESAEGAGGLGPGKVLGNYRLVRTLGAGGMATVYEAVHRKIGRRAAIKVLHARVARDPQLAQRFLNEARAVNLIRHPGLVEIDEFGLLDDGTYFLVMEHLDGEALDRRLDRVGRLGVPEAASIGRQIALALAAAHEQGVVHRDLKPGNVIVTRDHDDPGRERAKVLDFGIARLRATFDDEDAPGGPAATRTQSNVIMGTPGYMSPEQCRDTARVDEKTDVYSLGVMLFEMVAGRRPFVAELASEVMTMHVKAAPPALDELAAAPPALARLVGRMLAKDPAARPTMAEVAEALRDPALSTAIARIPSKSGKRARRIGMFAIPLFVLAGGAAAILHYRSARGGMVHIPGGTFEMGSTPEEIDAAYHYCLKSGRREGEECVLSIFEREQPRRAVRLSPYDLDATEVTNAAFARWLDSLPGLGTELDETKMERWIKSGDDRLVNLYPTLPYHGLEQSGGRFRPVSGAEDLPVTQVTWIGASRYCAARGARLPTEAEWEYAARPNPGDRFPWGNEPPRCDGVAFGRMQGQLCAGFPMLPAKVGTMAMDRSPLGVRDLAGNVAEWVQDVFVERYADCPGDCVDPVVAEAANAGPIKRVFRGGDWGQIAPICRSAGRGRKPQDMGFQNIGFRCARSVAQSH